MVYSLFYVGKIYSKNCLRVGFQLIFIFQWWAGKYSIALLTKLNLHCFKRRVGASYAWQNNNDTTTSTSVYYFPDDGNYIFTS